MADAHPEPPRSWWSAWRWPLVLIVLLVAVVLIVREFSPARLMNEGGQSGERILRTGVDLWRDFNKTEVEMRVHEFIEGLPKAEDDLALVVTRVDLRKSLYAENTKVKWGIDLGTTKVLLSVPARVHYAVDLTGQKPVRFEVDGEARIFHAHFPDPEVLAVEIFDDDKKTIVDTGWGRLRSRSGDALVEGLEDRKYQAVREKAESEAMIEMVKERARPVLARFIALYLQQGNAFGEGGFEQIEVHFAGDDPALTPPAFDESVISAEISAEE